MWDAHGRGWQAGQSRGNARQVTSHGRCDVLTCGVMTKRTRKSFRLGGVVPLLMAAGLMAVSPLMGCRADNNETSESTANIVCASGALNGAGSTFVQTLAQQWVATYSSACSDANVDYRGIGSSGGIQQFTAGTVDFAGTDVRMKRQELDAATARHGDVLQIPWASGAIAIAFRLASVAELRLSASTLAAIFAGRATKWDDPTIVADNPGVRLPKTTIQVIHRSDGSGTTAAFTAYLSAVAPDIWTKGAAKEVDWPAGQGAKGSDGVTALVNATEGSISYMEVSYAKTNELSVARVANASGNFVSPEPSAVVAALAASRVDANLDVKLDYAAKDEAAYPIATVTYVVVPAKPSSTEKAALLRSFVEYALGDGQSAAARLFYVPLPERIASVATDAVRRIGRR